MAIKRPYKKAKKLFPEMDEQIRKYYFELTDLEMHNCKIFDKVCHPFAELSRVFAKVILGDKANEYILDLCYNLGKWIYLIDALDDLEKDAKKKSYNPFIACFDGYKDSKQFVKDNIDDLEFVFYSTLNKIAENFNDLDLGKYYCVLKNVLHVSVRDITAKVFAKYLNEEESCDEQSV